MMKKKSNFRAGFTLIEMLIYIACLVLVISVIVIFGINLIRTGAKINANAEILENSRRAVEILSYEIRKSKSIYIPTSAFDSNPGQLSLEQTNALSADEINTYLDFFKCGDSLCAKREGGNPFAITSNRVKITNLVFTKLLNSPSAPSVQLSLRLETAASLMVPNYSASIEITTAVNLRGY